MLAGTALALSACHEEVKPSITSNRGLSDWLVECSAFSTYDAGKALTFDYDGAFELDRGENQAAWDRSLPEHVKGKWSGEENGLTLDATLPGKPPVHYMLLLPANGHTCILAANASPVQDLRKAWLGSLKAPDGEDDDDP